MAEAYDVIGLGSPIVDYIISVDEVFLKNIAGEKGGMILVDYQTIANILEITAANAKAMPGGSCANSIRGLARLGYRSAFIGKIGRDDAGKKFLDSLTKLNIKPLLQYTSTPTAQVACLITPDFERTMRTFLGAASEISKSDLTPHMFAKAKHIHIEGYTLFNEGLTETAMKLAKAEGATISLDLGSFEVVERFRDQIKYLLTNYVDVVFGNQKEMLSFTKLPPAKACELLSSYCKTVVVLMGSEGCIVGSGKSQINYPALKVEVVDTTGAGDLFISGFLHGYLQGASLEESARYGVLTGGAAVQVKGVEIPEEVWKKIEVSLEKF